MSFHPPACPPGGSLLSVDGVTLFVMPTVFVKSVDRPRFHRTEDCSQLTKSPPKGHSHSIRAVDITELTSARPCRFCYPRAPRSRALRRHCYICNPSNVRPCEHNGGVLVTMALTTHYVSTLRDPGDEHVVERYVWPDQVWMYEPV